MKGALKRKMQDVFNYYGKPEINDKDGTKPKARRAKKRFDDNNNNNNNNNTVIEYFGVMSEEDVKSRFSFCQSMKSSSSASPAIDDDDDDDDVDDDVEIEKNRIFYTFFHAYEKNLKTRVKSSDVHPHIIYLITPLNACVQIFNEQQ